MTLKDALVYFGVSGFVSKAALGRGSSLLPSTILVFPPALPSFGVLRQRWVLSAIAQSRPQPPLVPIFLCGYWTPKGGGGGLRPPIDSGDSPALCAISC